MKEVLPNICVVELDGYGREKMISRRLNQELKAAIKRLGQNTQNGLLGHLMRPTFRQINNKAMSELLEVNRGHFKLSNPHNLPMLARKLISTKTGVQDWANFLLQALRPILRYYAFVMLSILHV